MTSTGTPADKRGPAPHRAGRVALAGGLLLGLALAACLAPWAFRTATGTSLGVRYGGAVWLPVDERTPWLPTSVRLGLRRPPPAATPGAMAWRTLRPGFEVAELPVVADGREADRILLARIDPTFWRFEVRNDPGARHRIDDWMGETHPALAVNGSYHDHDGAPATPVVISGRVAGPARYAASQGAFVARDGVAGVADLAHQDWRTTFHGAQAAMVSYPLLLAEDGTSRAPAGTGWLANRSFVAEDRRGRIVIGTTRGGFFSLDRLADFLKRSPLDLKRAVDLDGGPVACQGVALDGFRRTTCGTWELQVDRAGQAKELPPWPGAHPVMPMALLVYPRRTPF